MQKDLQNFFKEQRKIEEEKKEKMLEKIQRKIDEQEHCFICYDYFSKDEFLTAKCGHSACKNCWSNLL